MKKEFKTLNEQIEILKNKGLVINNKEYAETILLRENYFFLNGYRHLFMKSNVDKRYIEGTTFEEVYSLFLFDRTFRNIIFKNILIIENNIKSIISYQLSLKYGYREKDYLTPRNFTNNKEKAKQVNDILRKMKRQISVNATQHSATSHYVTNYGYIPLWVLVKVLSFGIVGELYSILKKEDQMNIAELYNLDEEIIANYLTILSNYRNLCAHEDIVYENKTQRKIDDNKYHKLLNIPILDDEYLYGKNDLFALIIIMKQMLNHDEFSNMMEEIRHNLENLDMNLHTIKLDKVLDKMGFPVNYYNIKNLD
ncbi:MAG: Abi family protein [Bacilli bacterium]|nr:Abi family protein [Bacilli bacterium]